MSVGEVQLKNDRIVDNSILKNDFATICHQQLAQLNEADKNV